ncbi:hypothetical protein M6B38_285770 [Iris pallida]|uniref:Uncharacterized protein n=1 Tax=Iris pallida TaxID=29817 RepID=A0AAX6F8Q1_IRIPA|nr:hypothetical protein M6B38_148255 [Iris pallida]KAJ6845809.1 hypothetical protein M6B38_285770 [Iris pallida]
MGTSSLVHKSKMPLVPLSKKVKLSNWRLLYGNL